MPANLHIHKGDEVIIIAGKDRGKTGKVLETLPKKNRVVVEGLNRVKRHEKASQKNRQGGIVEKSKSLHASNVMLLDPKTKKPTRIGFKEIAATKKNKAHRVRVAKKSGTELKS